MVPWYPRVGNTWPSCGSAVSLGYLEGLEGFVVPANGAGTGPRASMADTPAAGVRSSVDDASVDDVLHARHAELSHYGPSPQKVFTYVNLLYQS